MRFRPRVLIQSVLPREMPRRYLSFTEAHAAFRRGKAVEVFLGGFLLSGSHGIRWVQIRGLPNGCELHLYETADLGSEDYTDVYEFGPLDPELEQYEANEVPTFASFEECLKTLETRWPSAPSRLTNEFMVQDEYADYLRRGRDA